MTFALDPVLLADTAHGVIPRATGELVWVHGQEQTESSTPSVHPGAACACPLRRRSRESASPLSPPCPVHDPLLHHIALVLQAADRSRGCMAGQLYAEALADALVVHFLRRYAASRPSLHAGDRRARAVQAASHDSPISRPIWSRQLSLATLAAVAQMSPTHFAHLFKHATGLAPHQYVILCRMEQAKRLLAETDMPLIEIGPQVGCADQSHFTALFRRHVAMTPKAYRNTTRSTLL